MGDNLSPDDGVALLGNTLATWGILYILISALGQISGAHFNPVVSMCFYLKRPGRRGPRRAPREPGHRGRVGGRSRNVGELDLARLVAFVVVQVGGAILGAAVAHAMFMDKMRPAPRGRFGGDARRGEARDLVSPKRIRSRPRWSCSNRHRGRQGPRHGRRALL